MARQVLKSCSSLPYPTCLTCKHFTLVHSCPTPVIVQNLLNIYFLHIISIHISIILTVIVIAIIIVIVIQGHRTVPCPQAIPFVYWLKKFMANLTALPPPLSLNAGYIHEVLNSEIWRPRD